VGRIRTHAVIRNGRGVARRAWEVAITTVGARPGGPIFGRRSHLALNPFDVHIEQVDQEFAHAGRVCFHGGFFQSVGVSYQQICRAPAFL
jgi:hypothetical protein